jgi:hypothetical protein
MRIPITDKFLWQIYNILEELSKLHEPFAPRTRKEAVFPELYKKHCEWERKLGRKNFAKLIYYLKKRGWIKIKNLEEKQGILLTKDGREKVLRVKLKFFEKKRRKDGKWIMIIFDIPEKERKKRDFLRNQLIILGYQKLQKSIWVCSYDVIRETEEIIRKYSLDEYVKIFLIEEIELD